MGYEFIIPLQMRRIITIIPLSEIDIWRNQAQIRSHRAEDLQVSTLMN
jgi:hypothetical protein